ncbi:possible pore-forming tail tip protein [Psychrobacter arcticus 273-4]|uniref:Possible pore-forming tail tip protein n=1 Tax=Psychrobacter arcticus (strain DSM 17307 / VKM B-2377 / 273-4) TaxID=259536 RepID=Q4FUJ3_PSYA2|nr:hypothetical protein [Psychrobacter arcticus]AAZ18315.1 possible pore-forming tail tip protein [Psychrobacter arcticus 273-4]
MAVLSYLEIVLAANSAAFNQSIADARTQTVAAFSDMREYANKMGPAVGAAIGVAAAATTALVVEQVALANELQHTANVANSSVQEIQKYTVGAKKMGIEQDALGAIFQDTSDKIGDFLSTGGGGMADFFENIAPQIGVTADEFRNLSGPQALQLYYDSLEKAKIGQNEMTFYMEAMASDATTLIPLLANGGEGFDVWAKAAANAGAVMDDETIVATQKLQATTDLLELSVDGAKTQFVKGFIPVLADVATKLTGTETASDAAYLAGQNLAIGFKGVAKVGIGVAATFDAVGSSIGGVAAIISTLLDGVGIADSGLEIAIKMGSNIKAAGEMNRMVDQDIRDSLSSYADLLKGVDELGSGISNATVDALIEQKKRLAEINQELGKTGQEQQEQQEAAKKAAEDKAKADKAALKAAKELGAAYVSNTALSGLKLKANEAIAGGKVRGYTAEFAEVTQSLLGNDLKYFSALNDTYHKGTNSKHASGQAFDVVLKNANQAASAAAIIKKAAAQYGYSVKVLNEYANPSKNATGGHLHVSVYGQKATKAGGADIQYIKQQNNALAQEQQRAASEQARILEQQSKDRTAIRMEYANAATRIEMQLANQIDKINASGFNDDERTAFIDDAIDVANTKLAQMQLTHDQEMQYAQQSEQTDAERIRNQYALERREIQLTIKMDKELRKAKIDALNQAEQLALDERRYAFESELRQLTSIGQSDLAALRQSYADQRRALDMRTDINPSQKSDLRNAMAGAQIYDTGQLQKGARDGFNAQQADMNGTGANYSIAQQYKSRLDVIKAAEEAELNLTVSYQQAKLDAQREFVMAATQLTLSTAEQTAASLAGSFKTMLGEQNLAYKLMFAGQQSFVMASAGLNMYEAWGDAMAEGATLSQKIAGAATIATEFARIISAASSMTLELPGYQTGGFTATGRDSDPAGLVHANEFVANAPTTRKYRPELEAMHNGTYDRQSSAPNINVNVTVSMDGNSNVESNSQYGKQIGQGLAAVVSSEVMKMMRPNGTLDKTYAKR